jgi:hypothetical protein
LRVKHPNRLGGAKPKALEYLFSLFLYFRLNPTVNCRSFHWRSVLHMQRAVKEIFSTQHQRCGTAEVGLAERSERETLSAVATTVLLGFLLYLMAYAEAWVSSVMSKYYHEDAIIINIIQKMIWKPLHIRPPQSARIVVMASWVPLN